MHCQFSVFLTKDEIVVNKFELATLAKEHFFLLHTTFLSKAKLWQRIFEGKTIPAQKLSTNKRRLSYFSAFLEQKMKTNQDHFLDFGTMIFNFEYKTTQKCYCSIKDWKIVHLRTHTSFIICRMIFVLNVCFSSFFSDQYLKMIIG